MRFTVVTIFPELFESALRTSLLGKAVASGAIEVGFVDPREFTSDRHRTVDDAPYGGGPGMVMKVEPLAAAIESAGPGLRILLTPAGEPLVQDRVQRLAKAEHIVLVCGRYEGIDERVSELCIDAEISIGDFVMTGGEIAALAIIDAVSRFVPGVLGEAASTDEESFSDGLLEYPQYTRPAEFRGRAIPPVLASGDHGRIRAWRRAQSLRRTAERRPELLARRKLSPEELASFIDEGLSVASRTWVALVHHPVHDRTGAVVTTAITTLDIHDIARSAATYGLAGYLVLNPIDAQREKVERVVKAWRRDIDSNRARDHREEALELIHTLPLVQDAVAHIEAVSGERPLVIATSADRRRPDLGHGDGGVTGTTYPDRPDLGHGDGGVTGTTYPDRPPPRLAFEDFSPWCVREHPNRPVLLLFGTGWGLTGELLCGADAILEPLCGGPDYNHLSVRSAVAAVLDRLFGRRCW